MAAVTVHTLIPHSLISSVTWLLLCAVSRRVPSLASSESKRYIGYRPIGLPERPNDWMLY